MKTVAADPPVRSLQDKYSKRHGHVLITGVQALVRLMLVQAERDRAAGLNTAGFVSGYRGSPLGTLDSAFATVPKLLDQARVVVRPAVNEEMAATAIGGTQHIAMTNGARVDGVFALWYGKGPGVDRAADALRHANYAGASRHGGVVVAVGDDHMGKSSSLVVNSNGICAALHLPLLYPADVSEIMELGLHAYAASRLSGSWIAMKILPEVADSTQVIDADESRITPVLPEVVQPADGLNIRWPDTLLEQEHRQHRYRLHAAQSYVRANGLDRSMLRRADSRIGLISAGKSWLDLLEALELLGLDETRAAQLGLALYKLALIWPLEPDGLRKFAAGLDTLIVIEEKGPFIETQVRSLLYGAPGSPRAIGHVSGATDHQLPDEGVLTPERIAAALGRMIVDATGDQEVAKALSRLHEITSDSGQAMTPVLRKPHFCSGCPHNTSTRLPEGSRASAGIGCHSMAVWIASDTAVWVQMGGEGIQWTGLAPFTNEKHVFANLGDGTYFHSGSLAIRQAVAAGANITYKILYNDAVAMTGGQRVDGVLTVPLLIEQLRAEGVQTIVVVTDDTDKYQTGAARVRARVEHRDNLDRVQRELREVPGVSVLVYEQMCATELRRQRRRGLRPDPPRRVFINELVCEGCGDCSVQSNCLSVEPLDTEFGTKRRINQSSCNKDFSCTRGFCPSFVTVTGGVPRKAKAADLSSLAERALPDPVLVDADHYRIIVAGIGGTGIVTIGALLTTAAHLSGRAAAVLDEVGMAQKGGAVLSSIHIATDQATIKALKIPTGGANLVLACDQVVATGKDVLAAIDPGRTCVVANADVAITGEFTRSAAVVNRELLSRRLTKRAGASRSDTHAFSTLAQQLFGDAIAANLMMVGYAFQKGLIPVEAATIEGAIELNGAAVAMNSRAFRLGRLLAVDPNALRAATKPYRSEPETIESLVARRIDFLTAYQDSAYARRFASVIERVRRAEQQVSKRAALATAVARSLFKLLAYKDEYEVARLYTDGTFERQIAEELAGEVRLTFHLAPPLTARRDPTSGHLLKRPFGPWMLHAFRVLARFKRLRGTWADPFGYTAERRMERQLIREFEQVVDTLLDGLRADNLDLAVQIAALPMEVRGYGHVKEKAVATYRERLRARLAQYLQHAPVSQLAEAG